MRLLTVEFRKIPDDKKGAKAVFFLPVIYSIELKHKSRLFLPLKFSFSFLNTTYLSTDYAENITRGLAVNKKTQTIKDASNKFMHIPD